MVDTEVARLRKLRDAALRARTLGQALEARDAQHAILYARSCLICWGIARVATGRLRAHPYRKYQQGPGHLGAAIDRMGAAVTAAVAVRQGRSMHAFCQELSLVARELDDARSLTWLPDLSDALGRAQVQMRELQDDLDLALKKESGAQRQSALSQHNGGAVADQAQPAASWPYLTI